MTKHLALLAILGASSVAEANVEIGGTAGVHLFSSNSELGTADRPDAPSQRNSGLFGLRVGVFLLDVVGIEGEVGVIPTTARDSGFTVVDLTYRAHLVTQLRAKDPTAQVIPFVFVGAGAMSVIHSKNELVRGNPQLDIEEGDTDATYYAGAGVKLRSNMWGLRLDARVMAVPSSENTNPPDIDTKKVTADYEVLASFYVELGRTKPMRPEPVAPPVDDDPDRDTVRGSADQCPDEPEDPDGFADDDGCPEPDNDADGLADGADKCPMDAEDRDGFQDDDGCPEQDNDLDQVSDNMDGCPGDAEDKDGFQDDDGCPDPDNDGDGVADAADKCGDQPETTNGFQDDDGCPDTLPVEVAKFAGAIEGIGFRVNTADLSPASRKTLDAAVKVLQQYPDLRIEIGGHTDDAPLKSTKKFADNTALSQARADAVRAYLVGKGIAEGRLTAKGYGSSVPVEDPTGKTGRALTSARTKNRRVEFKLLGASTP